jgi:hypothetical protein
MKKEIKMNTNQLKFGSLFANRSFQISLILGLVLLALLAAYVSDLSTGSAGELAGRRPPAMPAAQLQGGEDHLAGWRSPMPRAKSPELAGPRRPMPPLAVQEEENYLAGRKTPISVL